VPEYTPPYFFLSQEIAATGVEQEIEHGMGKVPEHVLVVPTGSPVEHVPLTVSVGNEDELVVRVTVAANWAFRVLVLG
jgi:hypothetical protein